MISKTNNGEKWRKMAKNGDGEFAFFICQIRHFAIAPPPPPFRISYLIVTIFGVTSAAICSIAIGTITTGVPSSCCITGRGPGNKSCYNLQLLLNKYYSRIVIKKLNPEKCEELNYSVLVRSFCTFVLACCLKDG